MKLKLFCLTLLCVSMSFAATAQEIKVVTIVESIVPGGLGRSRIIDAKEGVNFQDFTTERTAEGKGDQGDVKRGDVKIDAFGETKLLNFYSMAGINFQNIASNDAVISSKINTLLKEGWDLIFVTSGVESDAGKSDGNGIFITRLYFKK